jgi:hypothetical protein
MYSECVGSILLDSSRTTRVYDGRWQANIIEQEKDFWLDSIFHPYFLLTM